MTKPKKPRPPLTPTEQARLTDLREKLKLFEQFHMDASAKECRRKIRAICGHYELMH